MIDRLGVLGGMFDPVHRGHLQVAHFAVECLRLQRLLLVPCARPNHRNPALAADRHRLAMLELARAGDSRIMVDAMEIRRQGISYSVDTMAELRERGAAHHLVFIMGLDAFNSLPNWHQWERLLDLCHILVLSRGAGLVTTETATATAFTQRRRESASQLFAAGEAGGVLLVEDFAVDVSSTTVRNQLQAGSDVSEMLPPAVYDYIRANDLYASRED